MAKQITTEKKGVAEIITGRILEIIETTGTLPWSRPWIQVGSGNAPRNFITGRAYQGINAMLLFSVQQAAGYTSSHWLTFKQAQDKGGMVRKGEKGTPVVYYSLIDIEDKETGDEKKIPFLRYSTVFNLAQVDGIEVPAVIAEPTPEKPFDPIEAAEAILAAADLPTVHFGGNRACYSPSLDYVKMPHREQFKSPAEFYSTFFHEAAHSTGSAHRLNRKGVTESSFFGSHEYSKEELVAEITAASLSHEAGFFDQVERNSAAYVKSWAKALKDDKTMIIWAAGQAQKAFNYLMNIKGEEAPQANQEPQRMAA